ncbi:unnamed protein product [Acanthoscelides obtectus]|uniref:Uncharacterized protein n=1 Tax=Acanthoscelides obtectus TaxID=200917 RepID=A0A9P0LRU2_ACAOB|nr:unnamed protein product [Acanthoscelides obtectus]CAK1629449.1 hypothetical protein AOBTE_LOCUS5752 [Acanthoscelides obtectus]
MVIVDNMEVLPPAFDTAKTHVLEENGEKKPPPMGRKQKRQQRAQNFRRTTNAKVIAELAERETLC